MPRTPRSFRRPPATRGSLVSVFVAGVLALLALTLGVGAADATPVTSGSSVASSNAAKTGWIRAGHLSPGTPKVDVRLTPYAGGAPRTLTNVDFGEITDYTRVPVGLYTVALVPAGDGDDMSVSPMISRNVSVREGTASTVIATGKQGDVRASVLDDDLQPPPAGQAKVRLVSAATTPENGVTARIAGGPLLANDVTTGSSTGYATVKAQTWSVSLSAGSGTDSVTRQVPVRAGGVYTLVALDGDQGGLQLRAVKDASSSTSARGAMPVGGVQTGGGGTATDAVRDGGAPAHLGLLGVLAAMTVVGGGVVLAGRRGVQDTR